MMQGTQKILIIPLILLSLMYAHHCQCILGKANGSYNFLRWFVINLYDYSSLVCKILESKNSKHSE